MNDISVTIIAKNEAARIRDCLESVRWSDDIVVVDDGSTDETVAICREYTRHVFLHPWAGYAAQKNFAIEQTRHRWVLSIDADERVSPQLAAELQKLALDETVAGYLVPFRNYLGDRWMRRGGLYPDLHLRLFKKEQCLFEGTVHERLVAKGPVSRLNGDIFHYTYRDFADYLAKINLYTTPQAEGLAKAGRSPRWILTRAGFHFARAYVWRGGWRDGAFGLLYCSMIGLYPLVLYAKLWHRLWEMRRT